MGKVDDVIRDKYTELGVAMFAYITGCELHQEQIDMLANANDKQILLGMECVSIKYLKGQDRTNFCRNKSKVSAMEKDRNITISDKKNEYNNETVYLMCLGSAMLGYYYGVLLDEKQIELIVGSSFQDRLAGIELTAEARLIDNPNYATYSKNSIILMKKKRGNKKK